MSTLKNPVGPQSSRVYWRRRTVVGLGLLAVIIIVALIFARPGASTSAETREPDAQAESGATPEETDAPKAGVISDCAPGQIEVIPVTDASEYPAGVNPQLSFSIANIGTDACRVNAGTSAQVYTVTSGRDVIWVSTDCQSEPVDQVVTLQPATPVKAPPIPWERVRSAVETCDVADRQPVVAGGATYNLEVEVAGVSSGDPKSFLLF